MKTPVFEFRVADLLEIRVTGNNAGRVGRYCARRGCGENDDKAKVEYRADRKGDWRFLDPKSDAVGDSFAARALPVFYETTYQAHCTFLRDGVKVEDVHVVHPLASVADEFDFDGKRLTGPLNFVNTPGRFTFEVAFTIGGRRDSIRLVWWVVSEKLDVAQDYEAIVERVEKASDGIIYAFLSKTKNAAGLSAAGGTGDAVWYDIFRQFVSTYQEACDFVVRRPHLKYISRERFLRPDRIKRWNPQLANRYEESDRGRRENTCFRSEEIVPEVDTVENRFVLFTILETSSRLARFAARCRTEGAGKVSEEFVKQMDAEAETLDETAHLPFFRPVGRFTGFKQESLALQRKRGYAEIYDTWLKLEHSLDLTQDGLDAGNKPVWKLYEFWCFLVLRDYLAELYPNPKGSLGDVVRPSDIFEDPYEEEQEDQAQSKGGRKCEYVFNDSEGNREIVLTYQMSYGGGKSGDSEDVGNFSYAVEQIPDIVMTIRGKSGGNGGVFTYLFDAKYRVAPYPSPFKHEKDASPRAAINDMHRYRDAILYRVQKGEKLAREIIGAYVLFPGRTSLSFPYEHIIEQENIGAIPLLPGEEGERAVKSFVKSLLNKHEARMHLGAALTVRGTALYLEGSPPQSGEVLTIRASKNIQKMLISSAVNSAWIDTEDAAVATWTAIDAEKVRYVIIPVDHGENRIRFVSRFLGKKEGAKLKLLLGIVDGQPSIVDEEKQYWVWKLG